MISPNTVIAYILGILAGMANSFLDTGTYPIFMEIYPNSKGTSNVVLKAFISAGQFFLPFIVSFLAATHMWYGWSFLIPATILVITFLYFMFGGAFPDLNSTSKTVEEKITNNNVKTNLWLDGTLFIIYGYISQATFYLVSQMLTQYGQKIGNLPQVAAHSLVSWYSLGL